MSLVCAACAGDVVVHGSTELEGVAPPSWEEFKDATLASGHYVVEGDIGMNEDQLRLYYDSHYTENVDKLAGQEKTNGTLDVWNSTDKVNLTYCVSNGFQTQKARALADFRAAAANWESVANVRFVYVPTKDINCGYNYSGVKFNIMPPPPSPPSPVTAGVGCFPTRGDFADFDRDGSIACRYVSMNYQSGFSSWHWAWTHEVGHRLGFHHERLRSECTKAQPASITSITTTGGSLGTGYDQGSVMAAVGTACVAGSLVANAGLTETNKSGRLSSLDFSGASGVYGMPAGNTRGPLKVVPAAWLVPLFGRL